MALATASAKASSRDVSFKGSFQPLRTSSVARVAPRASRSVVCSAQAKQFGSAAAAAALALTLGFSSVDAAYADVAGLTPCGESKAFEKRRKNEVKALQKRQKQYEDGSAPFVALQATIDRTNTRFDKYGKSNLLCGSDGLPHLIADPGLALRYGHANDMFIPTIGFLYIAGWIGSVGRRYLNYIKATTKDPKQGEIIIDVPTAVSFSVQGAAWPFTTVAELLQGKLVEDDSKITVSPR